MILASCSQSLESRLDRILKPVFPADEPGAAVLVMKGDTILFDKGYGLARMDSTIRQEIGFSGTVPKNNFLANSTIDGDTHFNIASISKQFTAVAILQLEQEGKLSLGDPVSKYFPEFESNIWEDVRIAHLLSHSSGIPDARGYLSREEKIHGDEDLAIEYMKTLDYRNFFPGSAYEYINPTFVLCGRIVEKVSGQPFTEYVREHIFKPAGMADTYYFDRNNERADAAHGYEYDNVEDMPEERTAGKQEGPKEWYEYDFGEETFFATRPDGGIYSTTHDFVKWEKALRDAVVLNQDQLEEAFFPRTQVSGSPWSDYQNRENTWYGFGWFVEPATETTPLRIYHTGDNGGFKALAARYPDFNILIVIFANRADWDRYELWMKLEKEIIQTNN